MWSEFIRPDPVDAFGERPCMAGGMGHIRHSDILPLMMANAGRLTKFGA
jgi:2,3-bisphosphoglycerate-independent phosphoglycerate mutase